MGGLPQSRAVANDQSRVTISAMAPASLARCTRARLLSRPPIQNSWKNVFGLAATTSSTATLANELSPIAVPASAAPRATATSPSGCTACTPVGDATTGSEISCPSTEVAVLRVAGRSAMRGGASPSSLKAATLSCRVIPFSLPASRARKTERGSRRRARRRASATVSNHSLVLAIRHLDRELPSSGGGGIEWFDGGGAYSHPRDPASADFRRWRR